MYYNQLIYKYFEFDAKCDEGINETLCYQNETR